MPWIVGLDEAGYGPNLGPLVQAAAAIRMSDPGKCHWERLSQFVRRDADADDGRLLIDDSKLVYSGPNGLIRLERNVSAIVGPGNVGDLVSRLACGPDTVADLRSEAWYNTDQPRPISGDNAPGFTPSGWDGVERGPVRCVVTAAPRFNSEVQRTGTKASVLADGVIHLLSEFGQSLPGDDAIEFHVDKQGGRNYYAAMIQTAFPSGWVVPVRESAERSDYRVDGLERSVTLSFRPRAEQSSLPVAFASMVAKYLREVFMHQFNAYWTAAVPGLAPTAGYPVDAKRFFQAIMPEMDRRGIPKSAVWRLR